MYEIIGKCMKMWEHLGQCENMQEEVVVFSDGIRSFSAGIRNIMLEFPGIRSFVPHEFVVFQ